MDLEALEKRLLFADIDLSLWGTGSYKTSTDLLEEINERVTKVEILADGRFLRRPLKVHIDIFWQREDGTWMFLTERAQHFPGGADRKRPKDRSVSEKYFHKEGYLSAAVRALHEELSIRVNRRHLIWTGSSHSKITPSYVYPGIYTQAITTHFVYFMTNKNYRPFYTEFKKGRLSIFMWRPFNGWKRY
jgi:hypothetical protein